MSATISLLQLKLGINMFLDYLKALVCFFALMSGNILHAEKSKEEQLKEETLALLDEAEKIAAEFYTLENGEDLKEITEVLLKSTLTSETNKLAITRTGRRFFLFSYPSDGYQIKGTISFVESPSEKPLLIFLRSGHRYLGLMNPASIFTTSHDYTVLSTTYRDGVSEGSDEFGGNDVNDVENLVKFLPQLEQKLSIFLNPKKTYMLGGSRGGMEMFLALARSSDLQAKVDKAVSLTGLMDLNECMRNRPDMRNMFISDFDLVPGVNEEEWVAYRNPINAVNSLRKDLPFLIIQGTDDNRISLSEGYHMVEALQQNGHQVTYIEVPGGKHGLSGRPDRMEMILNWFESEE